MPFPYKTALVTGASSGIGRALAERMIDRGVFVIAVGRRRDRLDELVARFGADKVAAEPFDVADLDALPAWCARIASTYPSLDCLLLNAGIQLPQSFASAPPAALSLPDVSLELTTNYLSPLHTTAHLLPHLRSRSPAPAAVVLVGSGLALVPHPGPATYSASKAALHSFAWTLRAQLEADAASRHVRVVEVLPPLVRTELHDRQGGDVSRLGLPLEDFLEEAWAALEEGTDEIPIAGVRERFYAVEADKRTVYKGFLQMLRSQDGK